MWLDLEVRELQAREALRRSGLHHARPRARPVDRRRSHRAHRPPGSYAALDRQINAAARLAAEFADYLTGLLGPHPIPASPQRTPGRPAP